MMGGTFQKKRKANGGFGEQKNIGKTCYRLYETFQ